MYIYVNNYKRNTLCAQFSVSNECLLQYNWALWKTYITTIRIFSLIFSYNDSRNGSYKLQNEIPIQENGSAGQSVCHPAHLSECEPQSSWWASDLHTKECKSQPLQSLIDAHHTHIHSNK